MMLIFIHPNRNSPRCLADEAEINDVLNFKHLSLPLLYVERRRRTGNPYAGGRANLSP